MAKPALVKLGGSLLTDKAATEPTLRRGVARRAMSEIAKSELPVVILHGAGSFAHPVVVRTGIGTGPLDSTRRDGVGLVMAQLAELNAHVVAAAQAAGLRPVPVPVHLSAHSDGGQVTGLPVQEVLDLLDDGYTPILHGSLIRDAHTGWKPLSADRILAELAASSSPRVAIFATDVDGVLGEDGMPIARVRPDTRLADMAGSTGDATGGMQGKLAWAFATARSCPTLIVGGSRGRILDALRGHPVVATRVEP